MKKIAILAVICVLAFLSCDAFYSNSLGSSRTYDPKQINLTEDNIGEWVKATVGNPPLADAVTEAIFERLKGTLTNRERFIFMEYAGRLAIEASGLGNTLLIGITDLLRLEDLEDDAEAFSDMMRRMQDDFNKRGGKSAADNLAKLLLTGVDDEEGTPRFSTNYANSASPSAVAEAMIVLLLGEMANDSDLDLNDPSSLATMGLKTVNGEIQVDPSKDPSDRAIVLAAYLNLISDDTTGKFEDNPFTYSISLLLNPLQSNNDDDDDYDDEDDE